MPRSSPTRRPYNPNRKSPVGRKVNIGGLDMTVVSDQQAEQAEMVVCMLEGFDSPFTDNLTGPCARCGRTVIFRPHVPKAPPKVCMECAILIAAPAAGRA